MKNAHVTMLYISKAKNETVFMALTPIYQESKKKRRKKKDTWIEIKTSIKSTKMLIATSG